MAVYEEKRTGKVQENRVKMIMESYIKTTKLAEFCEFIGIYSTHCKNCEPDGICYSCDTVEGRWSQGEDIFHSCDGCGNGVINDLSYSDDKTQLSYCWECANIIKLK